MLRDRPHFLARPTALPDDVQFACQDPTRLWTDSAARGSILTAYALNNGAEGATRMGEDPQRQDQSQ
jgi:hypothetical protein